jgi:tetratricopeptide (TPR) repeat protein
MNTKIKLLATFILLVFGFLCFRYYAGYIEKTDDYAPETDNIEKKVFADSLCIQAIKLVEKSEYDSARKISELSLIISDSVNYKKGTRASLYNLAKIFQAKGDYHNAIEYYKKCLILYEEADDQQGIARVYNNMGGIYNEQAEYLQAQENYTRSMLISKEIKDSAAVAYGLINIGHTFLELKDTSTAEDYFNRSLQILETVGDTIGIAASLINLGNIYRFKQQFPKALDLTLRSHNLFIISGNKHYATSAMNYIANIYLEKRDYEKAIELSENSISVARQMGVVIETREAAKILYHAYKSIKNFEKSLYMHELYITMRDSLNNDDNKRKLLSQKLLSEFEKKEALARAEQEKKDAITREELKKERIQRNGFIAGFVLMFALAGVSYRSFRNKQKANLLLAHKNSVIEEKQKEILDSINYAKRIQAAILPPERIVKKYLPDSFILYKPKDIVAGDFYWMEAPLNPPKGGKAPSPSGRVGEGLLFFAAADCTGHGVPGAMVSVVCNNALNRSVREYGITDPGEILDKTREIVIQEFEKSDEEVKDGMDIALCALQVKSLPRILGVQSLRFNMPEQIIRCG